MALTVLSGQHLCLIFVFLDTQEEYISQLPLLLYQGHVLVSSQ